jgi:exodeoxyribonuclease VII small subunit
MDHRNVSNFERFPMAKGTSRLNFEESMAKLDEIVEAMESGQIGIEDSINKYEEAMTLVAQCRRILSQAEQRIAKIQLNAAGEVIEESFDPQATERTADAPP